MLEFGISNADMARDTLSEAKSRPLTENGGEVNKNILSMFLVIRKRGNTYFSVNIYSAKFSCVITDKPV